MENFAQPYLCAFAPLREKKLNRKTLPAPARVRRVRIIEHEAFPRKALLMIERNAAQIHGALAVEVHVEFLERHDDVAFLFLIEFELVRKSGAAAALHAQAQSQPRLV